MVLTNEPGPTYSGKPPLRQRFHLKLKNVQPAAKLPNEYHPTHSLLPEARGSTNLEMGDGASLINRLTVLCL